MTTVGGFDPTALSYESVTVHGFWVSEKGQGDLYPFFVSLPGPQRPDGSRSVLGCTCQACGGTRGDIPAGVAHECIHTKAAKVYKGIKEVKSK